jgi:multiple sugar transport system substrate-binding protein
MQDTKKPLPASEPPPHPLIGTGESNRGGVDSHSLEETSSSSVKPKEDVSLGKVGSQEQIDAKLQNALTDPIEQTIAPPGVQEKQSKKGVPKIIFFFIFFFIILAGLIFLFSRFQKTGAPMLLGNKGEIVWWGIQHDLSVYKPLIDEFEKENPNIKIRYERQSPRDYQLRLTNALASGKGPDIFEIHNTWPAMLRSELSTLPSSVMSKEEFAESFYPVIVSNLTLDKGIVGISLEYDALTLFINEDVFTSALKSPPDTWSDLQDLAPQLTQTGEKGVIIQGGVALGITENVDHWQEVFALMLFQNSVNPGKPTGKPAVDVFSFYKSFSKNGVWNKILPNSTFAFSRGELAMYFGPTRRSSDIIKANPNLKFRTVKLPQLPKNRPEDPNYSYATYWVHSVSEKSKIKEGSWTFLKYLSREDSLKKINENIVRYETFGRAYPRPEMNVEISQDPIFGSIIIFAYDAKSFYLADNTYDGPNGINTLVNNLYEGTINSSVSERVLENKSQELSQILGKFGVRVR